MSWQGEEYISSIIKNWTGGEWEVGGSEINKRYQLKYYS